MQSRDGATLLGQGQATRCSGLYYPQDHVMTSFAKGIEAAMQSLRPVTNEELHAGVPRLKEIASGPEVAQSALSDRVVWWVQPTADFPRVWGEASR